MINSLKLYSPHQKQLAYHNSRARFRVVSFGRQAGKSTMCLNELLKHAWEKPGTRYWFLSPTHAQSKIQYRRLVGTLSSCWGILLKKNQTELRVKFVNNSEISFKSGESLDNLRGETLHGAIIDEVRDQHPELWPMVIRPMLTTTQGWASFVSTPRGFDSFHDLYDRATHDTSGQWFSLQSPSTCNPLFTEAEFQAAQKEMGEAEFAQEILAQFRDLQSGKAYINFGDHNHSRHAPWNKDEIYSPHLPFLIGLDFNLSPMAWSIGQKRGDLTYWFDEVWLKKSHTQEASAELVAKIKSYSAHRANAPKVRLAGDATGKAGQRAAAGQSDYIILCQALDAAGIIWENITPDSNPQVRDRVNIVNAACKSADGSVKLFVHPERCPRLKKDLERVSWKQGASFTLDQSTNPELTHSSDGVGYALCATDNSMIAGSAGRVIVIRR